MGKRLLHGKTVSDEQIQAWADEAEAGYDLSQLPRPRRGRPPVGEGPGVVVPVRLDEATLAALTAKAEAEGLTTRSDAVRAAVQQWVHSA
ncbi:ribbon-helix-helix protein, CopG family [Actinomyces capricornis]|uniref:ribbon-helix-helix protein, CopG family n=1 Tax=Actinomyces capricornis TaxID=2755559 RepID=UPI001CC606E8|nr:ribbon-helix-helix protein, CopG family [Actinomyces capricornis]